MGTAVGATLTVGATLGAVGIGVGADVGGAVGCAVGAEVGGAFVGGALAATVGGAVGAVVKSAGCVGKAKPGVWTAATGMDGGGAPVGCSEKDPGVGSATATFCPAGVRRNCACAACPAVAIVTATGGS